MANPFYAPMKYSGQDAIYFSLKDNLDNFLSLSATTDVTYNAPMSVTTQSIMTGQTVTDNFQETPKTITISGVVVIGYVNGGFGGLMRSEQVDFVSDFMDTMELWRVQRQIITVISRHDIQLRQCVITQFTAKRDPQITNGLRVDITFQELDFRVQLGRTTDISAPKPEEKSKEGAKSTKGSVANKQSKGSTATNVVQSNIKCHTLYQDYQNKIYNENSNPSQYDAYRQCLEDSLAKYHGATYQAGTNEYQWDTKNPYRFQGLGGNPTKKQDFLIYRR